MDGLRAQRGDAIDAVVATAYTLPTDAPEADGTFAWNDTTIVVVRAGAGDREGLGYTYADKTVAGLIRNQLAPCVAGGDPMSVPAHRNRMLRTVRNLGRVGLCASAISAVDAALWDLKARLLDLPLVALLGRVRDAVPIYGSGGFTSYSIDRLEEQLAGWCRQGIRQVKMKVGSAPDEDVTRVRAARAAIGADTALFVDANGAYDRKQALTKAEAFAAEGVAWFEEPVSSDDLAGLRLLRDRAPADMDIAAGEYGYDHFYFRRMLDAGAIDVLQADATRCGGITGLMHAASLCEAGSVPLSAHTAPALHLHPCCALTPVRHIEYFHDHVRIERLFFDGCPEPVDGLLRPDPTRPGNGLAFKEREAARYAA